MWIDAEDSLEIKKSKREYLLLMWKVQSVIVNYSVTELPEHMKSKINR